MNKELHQQPRPVGVSRAIAAAICAALLNYAMLMTCVIAIEIIGPQSSTIAKHAVGLVVAIASAAAVEFGLLSRICPLKGAPNLNRDLTWLWWLLFVVGLTVIFIRITMWIVGRELPSGTAYGMIVVAVFSSRMVQCWQYYKMSRNHEL